MNFSNWETENANTWMTQDERCWQAVLVVTERRRSMSAATARRLFLGFFPRGTPDTRKPSIKKIKYAELAQHWSK
jgi:hypothetical protein